MTDLTAARFTMAFSLGFHIILAVIGMVMPFLMAIAHRVWLRFGTEDAYRLTRAWGRGVAIFFAVGAVSGTALSFELGVLWPGFMLHAGPIIGMPFSLEGAAFFIEAIALGIYLYGWGRLPARLHGWSGICVGIAGVASGILVVSANGWMNAPTGFVWNDGAPTDIDPLAALLNPAWPTQATHMIFAAFAAVGFAVAGTHAFLLLRGNDDLMHRMALRIALMVGTVFAVLQLFQAHFTAQSVAERQPVKLAAMEALFRTTKGAPLLIGGIPDETAESVDFALEIPGGLSFLAFEDFEAEVAGLDRVPKDERPPVLVVHLAFQTMVAIGGWMALFGSVACFLMRWRPVRFEGRAVLTMLAMTTPLGFVAIEAGWIVTEVGRQPWIIYGLMKTKDAVTPVPGQVWHLGLFVFLYGVLGVTTAWMWLRQVRVAKQIDAPTEELQRWAFSS